MVRRRHMALASIGPATIVGVGAPKVDAQPNLRPISGIPVPSASPGQTGNQRWRQRHVRPRRSPLLALALVAVVLGALVPTPARAAATYRYNLYRSAGYLTQDPYYTACTAGAAMMMLNFAALSGTGGNGFRWHTDRVKHSLTDYHDLTSILWWERVHDTLAASSSGSDPHGWRNALNYFGWGSAALTDPTKRVYNDLAYTSFDAAVRGA